MPAIATETLPPRMGLMAGLSGGSGYLRHTASQICPIYSYTVLPNYISSSSTAGSSSTTGSSSSSTNTSNTNNSGGISNTNNTSSGCDEPDNKTNSELPPLFGKHIYRMNDIFHREDERVKTFDNWPLDWLDKFELARTGMFYTGDGDKVKCYFCEVEIGRWEEHDLPVPEHLRWSPNCPLLRRRTTNNVPIDIEALDRVLPAISYDLCGANDSIEVRPFAYAEGTINMPPRPGSANFASSPIAAASSTSSSGIAYFPEYPEYAIEAARLRSFAEWPRLMKQKPEQLSEAGFFYTGVGDRVKCFSCGGGLKDWDEHDEPWEQHALWLSKCRYLNLMKGQTYIEAVLAKHKAQEAAATKSQEIAMPKASGGSESVETATNTLTCDVTPAAEKAPECLPTVAQKQPSAPNSSIPEEKLCKICYAGEYNTAFLPCGHVVACAKCASSVTKCPLCRKPFTDVMRVYFS